MLLINKNNQAQSIVLTLEVLDYLNEFDYFFLFKHSSTLQEVSFTLPNLEDLSPNKSRYNEFNINPSEIFSTSPNGQYSYVVKVGDENGKELEIGLASLEGNNSIQFLEKTNKTLTFKEHARR